MGKAKKIGIGVGIAVAAFFILAIIAAASSQPDSNLVSDSNTQSNITPEQQPITTDSYSDITEQNDGQSFTPRTETQQIVNGLVRVDAGGFVVYPFTSPKDGTKMELTGAFVTYGNDAIKVFIADETLFNQWKDGKRLFFSGNVYYTSGNYVSSDIIHIPEGGGTWNGDGSTLYIVFDNTEEPAYGKQVNADIKLTYTRYVSE